MKPMTERNPFEDELMEVLRTLDAFDKRLNHTSGEPWPEHISRERNGLVWAAFDLARMLDMEVGVHADFVHIDKVVVTIELPLSEGYCQVGWHVPAGKPWDGHSRAEKTRRITEYTKDLP